MIRFFFFFSSSQDRTIYLTDAATVVGLDSENTNNPSNVSRRRNAHFLWRESFDDSKSALVAGPRMSERVGNVSPPPGKAYKLITWCFVSDRAPRRHGDTIIPFSANVARRITAASIRIIGWKCIDFKRDGDACRPEKRDGLGDGERALQPGSHSITVPGGCAIETSEDIMRSPWTFGERGGGSGGKSIKSNHAIRSDSRFTNIVLFV